ETLLCVGPFEVLRLIPAVFQPDEIKRQYRRLALILHPDKNRHPDAEAAFKKLTAAFEKLYDPVQQAASRAEANRRSAPRRSRGSSRSGASPNESCRGGGGDWGGGGGEGGGSTGEAPRWCREGEYVPEQEREKEEEETPDAGKRKARPVDEFLDDFENQEKAFKEEVALAKERNAERKRVKAEARAAADQARMDRLRRDVLGSEERAGEVEAKTASWQKFNSATRGRKAGGSAGRREKPKRGSAGLAAATGSEAQGANSNGKGLDTSSSASTGKGAGGGVAAGGGSSAEGSLSGPQVSEEKGDKAGFACWVCRRGFKSAKGLAHHEAKSELHGINVQLREFLSP
ncbi:unnamed protein product, partial [Laminaria digitata]